MLYAATNVKCRFTLIATAPHAAAIGRLAIRTFLVPALYRDSVIVDKIAPISIMKEHFGDPEGAIDMSPLEIRGSLHGAALLSTQDTSLSIK